MIPLRLKLTLWFVTLFAGIYLGLIAVVWFIGRTSQDRLLDEALNTVARGVGGSPSRYRGRFLQPRLGAVSAHRSRVQFARGPRRQRCGGASDLRVDTGALPPLPPPDQESAITRIGGQTARSLVGRAIQSRMVTYRVVSRDGGVHYIDLARATEFGRRQRQLFSDVLFVAGLIGMLSCAGAAWFLVGRATTPFERLAEIARRVGPDSETRFPSGSSGREIERLQTELNDALGRLEEGYRVRQRFLTNVAHDSKMLISVMLTQSHMLRTPCRFYSDGFRTDRQNMIEELRRLRGIIEGILALSRASARAKRSCAVPSFPSTHCSRSRAAPQVEADAARVRLKVDMLDEDRGASRPATSIRRA